MPFDIAEDVYRYLARDWSLASDVLTDKKCELLSDEIPELRKAYWAERAISYHKPMTRRAYLAAFAPRYAYILYACLEQVADQAKELFQDWHKSEGVACLLGGGPACEVFGLIDWLYEHNIRPRFLRLILLDRETYWRTFHSFLFADLLGTRFPQTLIVPSYEAVDFPVPTGQRFDRASVNYNFAQTAILAEARLVSLVNCLSEITDHRGVECHLRFLTRLSWNPQLVICADSAAKKRRPRMSWLSRFFNESPNFSSQELCAGVKDLSVNWLQNGETSQRVFSTNGAPRWEKSLQRWVYIRRTGQP